MKKKRLVTPIELAKRRATMVGFITMTDDPVVGPMIDITRPERGVQIELSKDGKVLWVNVDGTCRLRISKIAVPITADFDTKRIGD